MIGLSHETVRKISERKAEPEWMLRLRLDALDEFLRSEEPKYGPGLKELDLDKIRFYVDPETELKNDWEDVPEEIKTTFEKLGIPQAEREGLAGVGAQVDSEYVYHNLKKQVEKKGVVYLPLSEAVNDKKWGEMVQKHFMRAVRPTDHKYAALHAAVWSGGSFIYVPKGVGVEIPLQSYYRMNAAAMGQFEHTLIIVDEGADLHFIEGCSAPKLSVANLHAGCVELYVGRNAHLKYSTVESWTKNVFNLNTKRAIVEEKGVIEWVTGSFGSKCSMLYPCAILAGDGARMEYTGVTFAGKGQELDTGAKVIHLGKNTRSVIDSRSLSQGGGRAIARSLVKVAKGATGAKSFADCKSLILDEESFSDAIPDVKVDEVEAEVGYEASVGKMSEEGILYLRSRGITEQKAKEMMVRGFTSRVSKELPVEYAMEMNNLIKIEMEGL